MTTNQIAYQRLQEEKRANLENERREREESDVKKQQLLALLEQNLAQARKLGSEADIAAIEAQLKEVKYGDYTDHWLQGALDSAEQASTIWKNIGQGLGGLTKLFSF